MPNIFLVEAYQIVCSLLPDYAVRADNEMFSLFPYYPIFIYNVIEVIEGDFAFCVDRLVNDINDGDEVCIRDCDVPLLLKWFVWSRQL